MELKSSHAAVKVLRELEELGYEISATTRVDVQERPGTGPHVVTFADRLKISGGTSSASSSGLRG
jgi:hypothetical protein